MVSGRKQALEGMKGRYPWSNRFKRMSESEYDMVVGFIEANDHLSRGDFELKVNRMFLDEPNKPKNWTMVVEILANVNAYLR